MLLFVKGSLRRLDDTCNQLRLERLLWDSVIGHSGSLHCEDKSHKFFGSVRYGNIVMFSFSSFLCEVGGECGTPKTDVLGCVKDGIAQVSRASLFHVRIAVGKLSRLVGRW